MKKATLEYRMMLEHNRHKVPDSKLLSGSLIGKFPIIFDGGKTTIFITDLNKEAETRERYQLQRDSRLNFFVKKPKVQPVFIHKQAIAFIPLTRIDP